MAEWLNSIKQECLWIEHKPPANTTDRQAPRSVIPALPPPVQHATELLCTPRCVGNSVTARIQLLHSAKACDIRTHFTAPVTLTLTYKHGLNIPKIYRHAKNVLSRSRLSEVRALPIGRQTDRQMWSNALPCHFAGANISTATSLQVHKQAKRTEHVQQNWTVNM